MKRVFITLGILFTLLFCQANFAATGSLFSISATGTSGNVNITLCLNGKGPVSCQNYNINALVLRILTTIPNHMYSYVGIKINTSGYKIGNLGIDCIPTAKGYCLFSVSDTMPKVITLLMLRT